MAVWAIGNPSGCRNRATTANQSATAPTKAASANALNHAAQGCAATFAADIASNATIVSSNARAIACIRLNSLSLATSELLFDNICMPCLTGRIGTQWMCDG